MAASAAGAMKSNIWSRGRPYSSDTDTIKRFVEVPIVVLIPPMIVAKPTGISILEGEISTRCATPTRIGSIITTIGVLLAKALVNAANTRVASRASLRRPSQTWLSHFPTACNAPLISTPLARTSNRQIVISASLPKPRRNVAPDTGTADSSGNNSNRRTIAMSIAIHEYSSGISFRENRTSAPMLSRIVASA